MEMCSTQMMLLYSGELLIQTVTLPSTFNRKGLSHHKQVDELEFRVWGREFNHTYRVGRELNPFWLGILKTFTIYTH